MGTSETSRSLRRVPMHEPSRFLPDGTAMRPLPLLVAMCTAATIAVGTIALAMPPAVAGGPTVTGTTEGEKFTTPYGGTVRTDASASAGRYLLVDSNVTATGTVTTATAATTLVLAQHSEGAAIVKIRSTASRSPYRP